MSRVVIEMSDTFVRFDAKFPPAFRALLLSIRDWETQALVDRWLYRPIDQVLVKVLMPTRLRPNHVTVMSGLVGVLAAVCYAGTGRAWMFLGGLLLAFSNVLDGVDGQLARARGQCSETGKLIDNIADPTKTVCVMFGMAFGMQRAGSWGPVQLMDDLPLVARIYALGLFTGASLAVQVLSRNLFVDLYRRYGRGKSDPNLARLDRVRVELDEMRARGGYWIERAIVPIVLLFHRPGPPVEEVVPVPDPVYAARMLTCVRLWTFLGGGTQFTILVFASMAGCPVVGWLLIALLLNALYVPLVVVTLRMHASSVNRLARPCAP